MNTRSFSWRTLAVLLLAVVLLAAAAMGAGLIKAERAEAQSLTALSRVQWAAINAPELLLSGIQSSTTLYLPAILR